MKRSFYLFGGILAILLISSGCSSKHSDVDHEYLGHVPNLKTVNQERNGYKHKALTTIPIVKNIGEASLYHASELEKHIPGLAQNVIVTSIVNVNDFHQSSNFGRLYSDSMITNFKRLGWNVIDFRGVDILTKAKSGEFYLNREKLKSTPADSVVFVGTYGHYSIENTHARYIDDNQGLLINVRLLDKSSNQVLSASNVQLEDKNAYQLSLVDNCKTLNCSINKSSNFKIGIKRDDCKNVGRCECDEPNCCLNETTECSRGN